MTDIQKQAYEWALNQKYTSIAADYARVLAEYIQDRLTTKPLTVDELLEMDGEPVWVNFMDDGVNQIYPLWMLVDVKAEQLVTQCEFVNFSDERWIAYRTKPEGSDK